MRELAARAELSAGLISQVERGITDPSLQTLRAVAKVLNTPLFDLFADSDPDDVAIIRADSRMAIRSPHGELMYALDEVAARLAAKHNIIGTITAWAMRKLAESMEVLSRKAEEMSIKSLQAAETCETAKTELDDAYRPLTQATADAGLRTPSARVHHEN